MCDGNDVFILPEEKCIEHLCEVTMSSGKVIVMATAKTVICVYNTVLNETANYHVSKDKQHLSHFALFEEMINHKCSIESNKCISKLTSDTAIVNDSTSKITISDGYITSLEAILLPGSVNTAIGVVGTSTGAICVFYINGVHVCKIRETTLSEMCSVERINILATTWGASNHLLEERITDIKIGVDPLGQLEFIAIATDSHVWCVNIEHILLPCTNKNNVYQCNSFINQSINDNIPQTNNIMHADHSDEATHMINHTSNVLTFEEEQRQSARAHIYHCNSPLHVSFKESRVVKILISHRHRVSFSAAIAFIVILQNGEVHYVHRILRGGSLQLLREFHNSRLHPPTRQNFEQTDGNYARWSFVPSTKISNNQEQCMQCVQRQSDTPLALYRYEHSPYVVNIAQMQLDKSFIIGTNKSSRVLEQSEQLNTLTQTEAQLLFINDAMLKYSEERNEMNLIVAGTLITSQTKYNNTFTNRDYNLDNDDKKTLLCDLSLCASHNVMCVCNGWCAFITNIITSEELNVVSSLTNYHHALVDVNNKVDYNVSMNSRSTNALTSCDHLLKEIRIYVTTLRHAPTRVTNASNEPEGDEESLQEPFITPTTHYERATISTPTLFSVPDASFTTILDIHNESKVLLVNNNNIYLCDLEELRYHDNEQKVYSSPLRQRNATQAGNATQNQLYTNKSQFLSQHQQLVHQYSHSPLHCVWHGNFLISKMIVLMYNKSQTINEATRLGQHIRTRLLCATADLLHVITIN